MMKKSALTFLSICLLFGLAGCGDKNDDTTNLPESDTSKQTDSTGTKEGDSQTLDISTLDYSSPSIVIEFGEVDALVDLASKAQSFGVEEGTIAKITGLYSKGGSHPSIDQDAGDGKYEGMVLKRSVLYGVSCTGRKHQSCRIIYRSHYFSFIYYPHLSINKPDLKSGFSIYILNFQ